VIVRRERAADHDAVAAVTRVAFDRGVEAKLTAELREDEAFIPQLSLVAEQGGHVVGHVICTRASIGDVAALGLGPLAVAPRHQESGIGSALMHAVLGAADALDEPAVVLLGDPGFYRRFGFVAADGAGITPPVADWGPAFQVRTLTAWRPEIAGAFAYAVPFARAS
jgi:putative acetyltransferase